VTTDADCSDRDLVKRAASGNRAAFEAIVRRHKQPLFRFIRRYLGNSDDAYDVLQDTFVAAWTAVGRFDISRPLMPWLRTIALNKCRDFSRRQTIRRVILGLFASEADSRASTDTSDAHGEQLDRLDRAIAELPIFYKEPLLLTVVSGLSHQEAAAILKVTSKAIEMRVRRARQKLAKAMPPAEG
jgi:RNA polymerase sigma-70 factor (ECF subfamily)